MRPIEWLPLLVNQRLPSGPAVMSCGLLMVACVKLLTTPAVVMRPSELFVVFVNHRAPSGPTVISLGCEIPVPVNFVTAPSGETRPMELLAPLANQMAPSGPSVRPSGPLTFGPETKAMGTPGAPVTDRWPMVLPDVYQRSLCAPATMSHAKVPSA